MRSGSGVMIEACTSNYRIAIAAEASGADIIEICENLAEGGTTPGTGTITRLAEELKTPLYVLIRPRGGDFIYSDGEFDIMKRDIIECRKAGVTGISIGLLTDGMRIDEERTSELIALARPMKVSFNTAFDHTPDLNESLETLCRLGLDRVLTSGGFGCASDNLDILRGLVKQSDGRIGIAICGGININNYEYLARQAGVNTVHGARIL